MAVIEISSLTHPGVEVYSALTEAELRRGKGCNGPVFIAESPKVIERALSAGYAPLSFLCERRHISGDAASLIVRYGDVPVFTGERELLAQLTGYTLTRGVLCAMLRRPLPGVEEVLKDARRIVVIDGVVDATNVGAIFRSAAALGMDAVLMADASCDPLCRRAVRVSMGSVFLVPWTCLSEPLDSLHLFGFRTVAMALRDRSVALDSPALRAEKKLAIVMGNEGDGLSSDVIDRADYVVRIPMRHGVDSLNVAAAAAVAFWELRVRDGD